jgi:ribonucleoside-diphosphate reductase alpha chain
MEGTSAAAQASEAVFIPRRFTRSNKDVWDTVQWGTRTAEAGDFKQEGVEAPVQWGDQAVGIVAKLYFATINGVRENSVRQLITRIVCKLGMEGARFGYFGSVNEHRGTFEDELTFILLHQMAAFNTPVNINFGVPDRAQDAAACFLLSIDDNMVGDNGITEWWKKEAQIFKVGAGAGINLSKLRGSMESLSTGGIASGPCAYMRPADAGAGTIKSGGAHRRAAKMVCLDVDHPDIKDFIWLKPREDERMRALREAGFDLDPTTSDGERLIAECTTCQNANFSIRVTDEFMEAVTKDDDWDLTARRDGSVITTVKARSVLHEIAQASWQCADPGLLFHDTINSWHTTPHNGPITTCNPCAETHLNDDSSCNLASLNLLCFVSDDGSEFLLDEFTHTVDVMVTAMDITCSFSDLPTKEIEKNTRNLRQLGIGYANLGAALMVRGLPYDSDAGRDFAAFVTALLTGRAYHRSAELAEQMGAFADFSPNCEDMLAIIRSHAEAAALASEESVSPDPLWSAACDEWDQAIELGKECGFRNAQASVIAPTGTISFMMGCDTTGAEPAISFVVYRGLAASGTMKVVSKSVVQALNNLGYEKIDIAKIMTSLETDGSMIGLLSEHLPIFATALGSNPISPQGHIRMLGAIQPFISGAISKTVNVSEDTTVEDIERLYVETFELGIKAVAVYREGSKMTSVIKLKPESEESEGITPFGGRRRLPAERSSITHKFSVGGYEGYITAGMYEDGSVGEIFLTDIGKEGSTFRGMMGAWATALSIALQYGVPLEVYARKFTHMRFEPEGETNNPEIKQARSLVDYIMRWLISRFGDADLCEEFGVLTKDVKDRITARLDGNNIKMQASISSSIASSNGHSNRQPELTGPVCNECGSIMMRAGTCYACSCGNSTGCG